MTRDEALDIVADAVGRPGSGQVAEALTILGAEGRAVGKTEAANRETRTLPPGDNAEG